MVGSPQGCCRHPMMDIIQVLGAIYGFDYDANLQDAVEAVKRFRQICSPARFTKGSL